MIFLCLLMRSTVQPVFISLGLGFLLLLKCTQGGGFGVCNLIFLPAGDWAPQSRRQKFHAGAASKWVLVFCFFCFLSSLSHSFLCCAIINDQKLISCHFHNNKQSAFTSSFGTSVFLLIPRCFCNLGLLDWIQNWNWNWRLKSEPQAGNAFPPPEPGFKLNSNSVFQYLQLIY